MNKKPKCDACSTGWCKNHVFELNPNSANLYYRKNFKIRLCPRLNKQKHSFEKIIPLFNKDLRHYTPSFILDEEKKYYSDNDELVLRNHNLKAKDQGRQDSVIFVARHVRKRNYCFVCKIDYNDYLDHLDDTIHKKSIQNNIYSSFITEIEQRFAQQRISELEQKNQQNNKRESPTEESCSFSQPSTKSFDYIRKLIKTNEFQVQLMNVQQILN